MGSFSVNWPDSPVSQLLGKLETCVGGDIIYAIPISPNLFAPLADLDTEVPSVISELVLQPPAEHALAAVGCEAHGTRE